MLVKIAPLNIIEQDGKVRMTHPKIIRNYLLVIKSSLFDFINS